MKPTTDRQQSKISTGKNTTREIETNNNNNNNETNNYQTKANDNHIPGLSDYFGPTKSSSRSRTLGEKKTEESTRQQQQQQKQQRLACERQRVERDR